MQLGLIIIKWGGLFLCLMICLSIHAEGNGPDEILEVGLTEIQVQAARKTLNRLQLPHQQVRIDAQQIQQMQAVNTAELLEASGSVTIQKSQQGGGSPVIRGFEASRILLLVDGIRMNNLIYRSGHLQNIITTDHASISSLDILYGPSSVAYGSDALGGAISIQTKTPQFSTSDKTLFTGQASGGYNQSNHGANAHLEAHISKEKWATLISVSSQQLGDLRSGKNRNPFLPKNDEYIINKESVGQVQGKDSVLYNPNPYRQLRSGYGQIDLLGKVRYAQSTRATHMLNVQYSTSSQINRYDRLTDRLDDGQLKFAEWYYGPQKRLLTSYHYDLIEWGSWDRISMITAYQNVQESRHNRQLYDDLLGNRLEQVHIATFSLDAEKQLDSNRLRVGLDGNMSWLNSSAYTKSKTTGELGELDTRYPNGDNSMHSVEVYGVHEWKINEYFTLHDGIRLGGSFLRSDQNDDTFYPFAFGQIKQDNLTYSASAGLRYNPSDYSKLSLLVASGFRVPNIDDVGKIFDTKPGQVIVPNASLKPEQTLSTELAYSQYLGSNVRIEASAYYTQLWDAITIVPSQWNGQDSIIYDGQLSAATHNANAKRGYIFGGHFNVFARMGNFSADGSVNYTYGRVAEEQGWRPMDHIAPLFGRISLKYHHNQHSLELFSLFNGAKRLSDYDLAGEDNIRYATVLGDQGQGLPAWFTLNVRAHYEITPSWKAQFSCLNILDTLYRTFSSGINASGRSVNVSAQYIF